MSPAIVESFEKIAELSRGSYADVFKVGVKFRKDERDTSTAIDMICAAKFIKLPVQPESSNGPDLQQLVDENRGLCSLSHQNLVKLYDLKAMHSESAVAVFMELFEGRNLGRFIQTSGALDENDIRSISKQICYALEYLHANDVIHRNINSGTVIIGEDTLVKLVDFGLSIKLLNATSHHSSGGNPRGHPQYMAPEVFLAEETEDAASIYSRGSDIWAFGCVVYEMASGTKPHSDCRNMVAIVNRAKAQKPLELPAECSDALKRFFAGCMVGDRRKRTSAADLLKHEFLVGRQ